MGIIHYRFKSFSRGALLVLISSGLIYLVHWFVYKAICISLPDNLRFILDCIRPALYIMLPVAGWLAESWLGRYRAIVVGLLMSSVTVIVMLVSFLMLQTSWTPVPAFVLVVVALTVAAPSSGSLKTVVLPFILDQMIGASAEQLNAVVQWYYWTLSIGLVIESVPLCVPIQNLPAVWDNLPLAYLTLGSLSLSVVMIMDCLCHKSLDTNNKTGNPIKLIFQVLNYARKNKCPQRRSAFTYIDEEHPSRIDFGKQKFGGPFTEEEVEDVKTVFRLTPLLFSAIGVAISREFYDQFSLHAVSTTEQYFECVHSLKHTTNHATPFFLIPLYRLVIFPLVRKYVPSLLKTIGVGLFLCTSVAATELTILSIGNFYSNASHCIFDDHTKTGALHISLYWVLTIDFVNGVGFLFTMCSLFELVIAQTPNRMRGIMMGMLIAVDGFGTLCNYLFAKILKKFQKASPSCVFYYYLVLLLLMLLTLVLFVILSVRYKLREREKHVNIQAIAEEHYERYFDQEEEYMREIAYMYM